jgi:hypothetical protein
MAVHGWLKIVASTGFFIASGGPVLAQAPGKVANEEASYLVWVVFAGAVLVICASGFMNPKRSHLG